jgi:hypothetical protein
MHNPFSFYIEATDKFSAFSILPRHNIPVSDLYLINQKNIGVLEPLFEKNSFLLKPRRSGWGLELSKWMTLIPFGILSNTILRKTIT